MRRLLLLLVLLSLLSLPAVAGPSTWETFRAGCAGRPARARELLAAHPGPLVEGGRVVFLHSAPAGAKVEVGGDFAGWSEWLPMERLAGTEVFYRILEGVPAGARLEYKLRVDGVEALDPRNPSRVDNGIGGENSVLAMPGYRPVAVPDRPLQGSLRSFELPVPGGAVRKVTVYTPAGSSGPLPSLYVHDGSGYLERVGLALLAEDLVASGKMAPVLLVFVDPLERSREYDREQAFTREMVESIVPFVDARFSTRREAAARGVLGASMGGLVSLHLGLAHPEVFGRVASQSGAFGHHPEMAAEAAAGARRLDRLYLDVGLYDLYRPGKAGLLGANRDLVAKLQAKPAAFLFREYPGGHSWTAWRDQVPVLLPFLFPPGE